MNERMRIPNLNSYDYSSNTKYIVKIVKCITFVIDCLLELGETPNSTDSGKCGCWIEEMSILDERLCFFKLIVIVLAFFL